MDDPIAATEAAHLMGVASARGARNIGSHAEEAVEIIQRAQGQLDDLGERMLRVSDAVSYLMGALTSMTQVADTARHHTGSL